VSTRGARALDAYVARLNRSNPNASRLFREYKRASGRLSDRRFAVQQAKRDAGPNRSAAADRRIQGLQRDVDEARLNTQVAAENYAIARRSESNVSILQTISLPESATSDRGTKSQIVLFGAGVAGILLGIALASLLANRRGRRALALD
jgi:uncharacterized protein involved in exopolysaccharide biosynthesis